jgi:hypothetical protein
LIPSPARPRTPPPALKEGAHGPCTPGGAPQRARGPVRDCQHGAAVARGRSKAQELFEEEVKRLVKLIDVKLSLKSLRNVVEYEEARARN